MRFGQYDFSHDMGLSKYCINSWHAVTNTRLCGCGSLRAMVLSSLLFFTIIDMAANGRLAILYSY